MELTLAIGSALVGYLCGSLPFSLIITRLINPGEKLDDVVIGTTHVRSVSATTASAKYGSKVGCSIGILDMLKVALPTLIFKLLFPEQPYYLLAAGFGMVGHNWPVFNKFNGGSGVSSVYGAMLVIDWLGGLVCAVTGLVFGLAVVRDVLTAYLAGIWFLVPWFIFRTGDPAHIIYAVVVNILFMVTLIPEIKDALRAKREGQTDVVAALDTFPMGKGMLKIMKFIGIKKREKEDTASPLE